MKENEIIINHYSNHPNMDGLTGTFTSSDSRRIRLEGLTASSKALIIGSIFLKTQITHLVLIPEKEDAAYFYNDLVSIVGEEAVFFFPSTYKRSVQYGQTEPANIVLRTEVLNHLGSGKRKSIIVSYPESVMEKVVSKPDLKKNTFHIKKGDRISLEFLEEILQEYHFTRTDFVYEPGQYSIRGSIADVFSYSAEIPYFHPPLFLNLD
jgi:transcription-repair coupling factor (superfamily II helicase)